MLADFKLMAFLATTDAARARAFYEGVLGLSFVSEDDFAVVYDIRGIELRLQKVRERSRTPRSAGRSLESIRPSVTSPRAAVNSSASRNSRRTRWVSGRRRPAHGSPGSAIPTATCCR
jgi:catechol 2,3-dioxygenase-like lactoylglutathione lyase family enzyme